MSTGGAHLPTVEAGRGSKFSSLTGAAPSWTVWQGSSWSRFWSPAKQAPLRAVELGRREYLASTYTKHFQYITHLGGPVERELSLLRLIENLSPSTLRASAVYFDRVGNKEQV